MCFLLGPSLSVRVSVSINDVSGLWRRQSSRITEGRNSALFCLLPYVPNNIHLHEQFDIYIKEGKAICAKLLELRQQKSSPFNDISSHINENFCPHLEFFHTFNTAIIRINLVIFLTNLVEFRKYPVIFGTIPVRFIPVIFKQILSYQDKLGHVQVK